MATTRPGGAALTLLKFYVERDLCTDAPHLRSTRRAAHFEVSWKLGRPSPV